jgi:DNA-binding CsgD family transcriptional regulator
MQAAMVKRNENGLIEALYDAALGHCVWSDVGSQLVRHMEGTTLMLSVHHARQPLVDVVATFGMDRQTLADYAHFAPHDIWAQGVLRHRELGKALIGTQVVEERTLVRSLIYNEYLRPKVNAHYITGAILPMVDGYHAVVGTHRPADARNFIPEEAERLSRLLPHLRRALEIRQRLQQAEGASRSVHGVLDRLSIGVIMMGATGRLLHVNAVAGRILGEADGLVRSPQGLRAAHKEDDRRLQALIGGLRHGGDSRSAGGHLRIHRPSARPAYAVMLAPVGSAVADGRDAPAILVFVSEPGTRISTDLSVLADLFGFTPAEGRIVLALLAGVTPPEYARATGVTYNTVRTLLSRAMARTGSRSQVELVMLVAGAIGGILGPGGHPAPGS